MNGRIAVVPAILQENEGSDLRREASGLVRSLFPHDLKRLGRSRMTSISMARQDGGALAGVARMIAEAHALGARPEELLEVVLWLRSFVDGLRRDLDASDEALRVVSLRETSIENTQNVAQMQVASGDRLAEAELLRATLKEMAVEQEMVAILRKRLAA